MDKNRKILEYRKRLDKTLASPRLTNKEIKTLVKNQLLCSYPGDVEGDIENVVQKRTMEVSNFLDMLRSASGNDSENLKTHGTSHGDWKLKQDNDQIRVMYREGPQGTPFHTLLAEGYVDAPIDVCLCVSWESTLYKKWWPQFNIPSFKITMSNCLQKVCIGEEISLLRVKVPWPVSAREALLHYFEVEFFEEDLIIVLLNTISDVDHLCKSTHGFTNVGIPEAKDTVRLDLVGGFALQKISSNTSYFRTIATLDIKLDFVPPTLINFISRQLIGSGFKLYQKAVASAKDDEDFSKILEEGPLYVRVREGQKKSYIEFKEDQKPIDEENYTGILSEDHEIDIAQADKPAILDQPFVSEIEEDDAKHMDFSSTNPTIEQCHISKEEAPSSRYPLVRQYFFGKEKAFISPEVESALSILDKAIAIIRGRVSADSNQAEPLSPNLDFLKIEKDADAYLPSSKDGADETEEISTSLDFREAWMRRKAEREMGGRWIWTEDADDTIERRSSQGFNGIDELGNPRSDDRCSTRRIVKSQCKTEEIEPGKFVRKCERTDQLLRECIGRPVEIVESNTESTEEDVTNEMRSGSLPFEHSTGFEPFNFPGLRNDIDALERSMFGGLGRLIEAAEDMKNDFFQGFGSPYNRDSSFPRWKPAERVIENETPRENNGTAAYKDFTGQLRDV